MSHNRDLSAAAGQFGFHSSNIGIGTDTPGAALEVFHATSNTIINVKSGDSGAVLNLIDDSARSSIEQNGTTLKISSDTGAEDASSDIRLQVDGSTKMKIDSNGKIGINNTSPTAPLSIKVGSGGEYVQDFSGSATKQFGFFYDQNNWNAATFRIDEFDNNGTATSRLTITDGGKVGVGCDAEVDFQVRNGNGGTVKIGGSGTSATGLEFQYNNSGTTTSVIKTNYRSTSSSASLKIDTGTFLVATGANGAERFRISGDSKFGFNTANPPRDYCFHSGQADTNIQITNNTTGVDDSAGALIQQDGNDFYIWNKENSFMSLGTNAAEKARLYANGKLHVGNSHRSSSNLTRLHVGWNTGGTVAGESIIAGTLGNDTTAVSALLTMKNAGNRGAVGASGGSSLAKFEFNNGTAFEIDKYGRRTLQYQPAFKCKLSSATGANFTGILVFNSVSYNIGSHYNSSNGRFTAPVDGRYLFCWYTNMERAGGNGSFYADWMINGNLQGNRMYSHHSGAWELIGGTIIFDLNANDYVQIKAITSGNWDGGSYGSYSGYMLG